MNKEDLKFALQTINGFYNDIDMLVQVHNNEIGYIVTIAEFDSHREVRAYDVGDTNGLALFLTGMLEVIRVSKY